MLAGLVFFAEKKKVSNFCITKKLLTFLQQNINSFENTLATTVNEFVIDEHIKLTKL